jgi:hypothetical protein
MKWGKQAIVTWDQKSKLVDFHFNNGVRMDHVRKVFIVESPELIEMASVTPDIIC